MVPPMALQPGLSAHVDLVVSGADLATAIGSGEVEVLATPRVVALCEEATVLATDGHLQEGEVSVGTRVELDHLQPTLAGSTVRAHASLEEVDKRRLIFSVKATEDDITIATGRIVRVVVDHQRFSDRLRG